MKERVKGLLQQINFIETDMEIQKQILFSIPEGNREEMEKVVGTIAAHKEQIKKLRARIKQVDPEEYNRITMLEQATERFRQLSENKKWVEVVTLNETGHCSVMLNDGSCIECLVKARDDKGNWTVLTLEGETKQYPGGLVRQ